MVKNSFFLAATASSHPLLLNGMDRNHGCIERHEFVDISTIFLATNLYEQFKNMYYLKIKNFDLVAHVPFIRFLEAINWI